MFNWLVLSLFGDFGLLNGSHRRPGHLLAPETPAAIVRGRDTWLWLKLSFSKYTCWLKLYLLSEVQDYRDLWLP